MASSNLSLTYFDIRGLAEIGRIVLAYGKKDYKDVRVKSDQWAEFKPKTPLGQVPFLDIDGERFPQSVPIWTYLAKEFGLYPSSNKDQLAVDVICSVFSDIQKKAATFYYEKDEETKAANKAKALEDTAMYLEYLEAALKKNGTGYFVGSSVTLADIVVFDIVTGYLHRAINYSPEKYPLIAKNIENTLKEESIGAYVASRPDSEV